MHNSVNGTSSCTCAVKSKQPPPYYKPIQHETATLEPIMSCELDTFCQTTTHANKASTYQPFVQTQKRTCRGKMSRACMPEVLKLNKNTCICSGDLSQCACQKGYYWNMGACIACPTGSTTLEDGAVSLTSCTCMPGFVNTQPSNPAACEACGVGFFCNGESHRQACPANHTTEQDTSGNKSHCVCSTGVYLKDGSCTACPAGHFKIDVGNMPCQKCPHGRWSGVVGADTSLVCTACMAGATTQSSGATSVFECKCEPGLYGVNGSCMACIEGFYCPGTGEAVACPDGATSSRRASFPSDCICQPGRYAQGLSCHLCPPGHYKPSDGNQESCPLQCPTGAESENGSTSLLDCFCTLDHYAVLDSANQLARCGSCATYADRLLCPGSLIQSNQTNEESNPHRWFAQLAFLPWR